jgi:hypothetical protein
MSVGALFANVVSVFLLVVDTVSLIMGGHVEPAGSRDRQRWCSAHDVGSVDQHGGGRIVAHPDKNWGTDGEGSQALLHQLVRHRCEPAARVLQQLHSHARPFVWVPLSRRLPRLRAGPGWPADWVYFPR